VRAASTITASYPRKRGIQYAAAFRFITNALEDWIARFAGDDGECGCRKK
jgi:hypothetical protein